MRLFASKEQGRLRQKYNRLSLVLSKENWKLGRFYAFEKGEILFAEGDPSTALYLLVEGECRVFKTVESGKNFLISHYGEISVIGEVELFEGKDYQSTVQMLTKGICFLLKLPEGRNAIMQDLRLMRFIAQQLCAKVERSDRNTSVTVSYTLKERLSSYILYAQEEGVFKSNYTHLANHLGCSHRHLLRTLKAFCLVGILQKDDKAYRVLQIQKLEEMAGDEFYVSKVKI